MRKLVAIILALVWLFVVTFAYYTIHKPFEFDNLLALANTVGDVLTAAVIYAASAAIGFRIIGRFEFEPLETLVWSTGLGLGIVSLVTFGLGLAGSLNPILFWVLAVLTLILSRRALIDLWRIARSVDWGLQSGIDRALAIYIALVLLLGLALALLPPTQWDTIQYHLVGPRLAIDQGRITVPPDNLSLSNPALAEMLFLAAMVMKSDSTAQIVHLGYLVLLLAAMLAFCARYFTLRIGWLAGAVLVSSWTLWQSAVTAYSDMPLMFYGFAALSIALLTRNATPSSDGRVKPWAGMALAGVMAGFAMGEKYTSVFIALAVGLLILRPNRLAILQTLVFGVSAGIAAAPWYIRNWIFMGNPIYPFVLSGLYWDSFRTEWYSRFGTGLLARPLDLVLAPWDASIGGRGDLDYQGAIGPFLLALLPLQIVVAQLVPRDDRREYTRALWLFSLVLYLPWLWGVASSKLLWQIRLLFPAFPALTILAADGVERLGGLRMPALSIQRFTALVLALLFALTLFAYALFTISMNPLASFLGIESRPQYLERVLGEQYLMTEFVNAQLPGDAKILMLWETRAYYIRRNVAADAILEQWMHYRFLYRDADSIAQAWRRAGYTHVVLYREGLDYMLKTGYDPVNGSDAEALQELLARRATQIYGQTPLQVVTRDGKPGVWQANADPYAIYELAQ
jgi:hypothetical protein